MRSVFFIHDLLPLQSPEFFRPAERQRHLRRLKTLARYGDAAIVSTRITREALMDQLSVIGRRDMPVLVAPPPVESLFTVEPAPRGQDARPYFVMVGTIEPRKNHLTLLHAWREIVETCGSDAPRLVIAGERGWENEQVMDLIDRCPMLQRHVILASGLPTKGLARLIAGARALLAPSFAEGYGLPVVEALAAGTPVIVSDITVFHEIARDRATFVDPMDGPGWKAAIQAACLNRSIAEWAPRKDSLSASETVFGRLEAFLDRL
jgi:glycosyltransferase involved in cell wall biosynthesis